MPRREPARSRGVDEKVSRRRRPVARKLSWIINSTNPPGAELCNPPVSWRRHLPPDDICSVPMPDLNRAAWRRSRPPLPLAVLSLALLHAHGARAQDVDLDAPLVLKRTPQLTEVITPDQRGRLPSFVNGDRISGRPDLETVVEGNAT